MGKEMDVPKQLGPWKVGEKLGSGAFSSVYEADLLESSRSVGYGSAKGAAAEKCDWVLKISPVPAPGKKKKKNSQARGDVLLFAEYNLYRILKDRFHDLNFLPKQPVLVSQKYHSEAGKFCYLALERLGPSLADCSKGRAVAAPCALNIIVQLVEALSKLHEFGYVYRDVKPDNFLVGAAKYGNEGRVYVVDMGAAFKYVLANGKLCEAATPSAGTPLYMSRSVHSSIAPSPRDDLESLGYMLLRMLTGQLPWLDGKSEQDILEKKNKAWEAKGKSKLASNLVSSIQNVSVRTAVRDYFEYVDSLKAGDFVDYGKLKALLVSASGFDTEKDLLESGLDWGDVTDKDNIVAAAPTVSVAKSSRASKLSRKETSNKSNKKRKQRAIGDKEAGGDHVDEAENELALPRRNRRTPSSHESSPRKVSRRAQGSPREDIADRHEPAPLRRSTRIRQASANAVVGAAIGAAVYLAIL